MIIAFIDTMRSEGAAVESICRVLCEQGCQIAARTYRAWRSRGPAARTITDAQTVDAVRDVAWRIDHHGRRRMTPEGLYGRVKMRALLDRSAMPGVSYGAVDRAMKTLGLQGIRRSKGIRTRSRQLMGSVPATFSTGSSTPKNPTGSGSLTSPTFGPGSAGCTWCSSSTCSRAESWLGMPRRVRTSAWAPHRCGWRCGDVPTTAIR